MKNTLLILFFPILVGCTLVPCDDYLESDKLDSSLTIDDINGTYLITKPALTALENNYNSVQIDSMLYSKIIINSKDSIIKVYRIPMREEIDGEYVISSSLGKLWVSNWNHPKFRKIDRPDIQYPALYYREKNGESYIMVDLAIDPDHCESYEYKKIN